MISGVRTTIYRVTELAKAREWYTQAFMTKPYFDEPFYIGFNIDGSELGLQPVEKESDAVATSQVSYWGVTSMSEALEKFESMGASIVEKVMDVGDGILVAAIADPWGNCIGLIENAHFRLGLQDEMLKAPDEPGVTAIGGVFFKSSDPEGLKKWYRENLGIKAGQYGGVFQWRKEAPLNGRGFTAWSIFSDDTTYFSPSGHDHMINYRVNDLDALLEKLKANGVETAGEPESFEYGKFAWIVDPDGRKIELWESNDDNYLGICDERMESR